MESTNNAETSKMSANSKKYVTTHSINQDIEEGDVCKNDERSHSRNSDFFNESDVSSLKGILF